MDLDVGGVERSEAEAQVPGGPEIGQHLSHLDLEQKTIIEEQKGIVEAKNEEIEASINYAKRIQEAILASALMDSDDAVPAEYKPLVEEYYRVLSEDLR